MSYLEQLTLRLSGGLANLARDDLVRHVAFLKEAQRPDGGFAGREGESDLYYTSFAARALALSGELQDDIAQRIADFLKSRMTSKAPVVDFLSLIYTGKLLDLSTGLDVFDHCPNGWRDAVAETIENFRRDDGGYAKGPDGAAGSTYQTFLVILCYELLELTVPRQGDVVQFVLSQQRDDGGFVDLAPMRRSGTNPAAAAIGSLQILSALEPVVGKKTMHFLIDAQTDEGGLRANTRIPIADLLSTFTGILTLQDLNAGDQINQAAVDQYVCSLEHKEGGFHGATWDDGRDVEYTFYGLGARALLAGRQ